MPGRSLSYAVVTPARDEEVNLERLGAALAAQTRRPEVWVVVDDASTDGTRRVAERLLVEHGWIALVALEARAGQARGGPVVRAFSAGLAALERPTDVVVKLDADISMSPSYFAQLMEEFEADERLGMASGTAHELDGDVWQPRFTTGTSVWGAARAYRWECLQDVLPLEERMGWDGIDEHKAQSRGWETRTIDSLPFHHHRPEGHRDGSRLKAWAAQGDVAHYMHYRPSYLLLRALFRSTRDPAALAMLVGYGRASMRRARRCGDEAVRERVREQQRLRTVPLRLREALGRRDPGASSRLSVR